MSIKPTEGQDNLSRADGLIEDAVGWLSDIVANENTRDGESPSGKEITRWVEEWLYEATQYLDHQQTELNDHFIGVDTTEEEV